MVDAPFSSARSDGAAGEWSEERARGLLRTHAPHAVLALTVATAFCAYALLAHASPAPRVFLDELIYMDAASSLADGEGLRVREEPYGFAVLYPIVLAPLLVAFERDVAYELAKGLNAFLFVLAAFPVYLLARRLLERWASVAVAAFSVAIPSAMYASVVMTESLAYLLSCTALLVIVLALERPTVGRQLGALGVIALATLARPQFIALYAAVAVALVAVPFLLGRRPGLRQLAGTLWPTFAAGLLGVAGILVRPLVTGGDALGAYSVLWRSYSPVEVGRFFVYEVANLGLYLAVVPLVVAPIVVVALVRGARAGDERQAAFAALFVSVNAAVILLVAAFDSYHVLYLHDRYLFYVVPLWLVGLFVWLAKGAPRPFAAAAVGVGLAALVGLAPLSDLERYRGHWRFHALGTAFPTEVADALGSTTAARVVLAALAVGLAAAVLYLRARAVSLAVMALACVFLLNSTGAWGTALDPLSKTAFPLGTEDKRWVDTRVPAASVVTLLYVSCEGAVSTERWQVTTNSVLLTEFFNSSVGRVLHVGGADESAAIRIRPDGTVVQASTLRPVRSRYVVAQSSVPVDGRRIAAGTAEPLVLWRSDGPLRTAAGSNADLRAGVCREAEGAG